MKPVFQKRFSITGLAVGLAGVLAVTVVFSRYLHANASTIGFFFLIVVLGVATSQGFRAAALVSVAAMLCYNFFYLPPVGRFTIADPENWVALFTFLLTALVASHLSDSAQQQAAEAKRRQQETEQLYAISRSILLTEATRPTGTQAAQSIAQIFDSPLVMIFDGASKVCYQGGADEADDVKDKLQDIVRRGSHQRDDSRDLDIWPITLGGNPVGALAAKAVRLSDGAVQSLLNLVAIALERVRTMEAANLAEIARRNEEFKSTLLDAIAHEFKTPLTSIKAAATGLRATDEDLRPDQRDLTLIIEEETDRLSHLVTEAVRMTEIDAGNVKPQYSDVDPIEMLAAARNAFEGRGGEQIQLQNPNAPVPLVHVDKELLTLAIRQVLDNALKYSDPGSMINCSLTATENQVRICISDHGPGIPESDHERIFEKFYRRASVRSRIPGTGLGLHIAREIARIHGGDLWIEPQEGPGAVFCLALPRTKEAAE